MLYASLLLLLAQPHDLLLRGGRLIDSRNGIDAVMDVAIAGGKVAEVAPSIDESRAKKTVPARGLLVVPGLVDLHAHVFFGTEPNATYSNGYDALPPDGFTFRSCVTTVVDTGGAGWRNFIQFKEQVIDRSQTRVLALLNIVGSGMKGGPVEQNLSDMDPKLTALRAREFPGIVVGVKVAHYRGSEWDPVDRAVEAGTLAGIPVMVDFGSHDPPLSLEALLLTHLRPGDILTHTFAQVDGRMPVVDAGGQLQPFARKARERGIVFDLGHGAGSFVFRQARAAMEQGFPPDTVSTDLHRASMNAGMKDMLNVMSKLMSLGMSVEDAVEAATSSAARAIHRDDIGHLAVGAEADVALLSVREGDFGFVDVAGGRNEGRRKLECELTLRAGNVVWDLNGLSHKQ
jgi:dihydroorotase